MTFTLIITPYYTRVTTGFTFSSSCTILDPKSASNESLIVRSLNHLKAFLVLIFVTKKKKRVLMLTFLLYSYKINK